MSSYQSYTSIRNYYTDTVTYQLNHTIAVFGSGGWEDITYGQAGVQSVHDMTWSFGTTLTPSPDTALTLSYGHRDGFNRLRKKAGSIPLIAYVEWR